LGCQDRSGELAIQNRDKRSRTGLKSQFRPAIYRITHEQRMLRLVGRLLLASDLPLESEVVS